MLLHSADQVEIQRHPERGIFGFHINEVSYHDGAMAVVVTRQDRSICNAFQDTEMHSTVSLRLLVLTNQGFS